MKKNDIALLIFIVSVTAVLTYFVGRLVIGEPKARSVMVETVTPISPDITQPSPSVFNKDAINPTVPITIGKPANLPPFGPN
ncbi:MAG: hypothetical protein EOT04_01250 [Candidatus Chaera renei]|uniref:Uncharacterized protein n=1 Tax=Candidatus Chaera renei TaxID=2506947 RepID=A0A4Q0AJH1_9BACT|nr:MAG: hypothetical protein EOT04_01250 [Candidatus Chaera renei]